MDCSIRLRGRGSSARALPPTRSDDRPAPWPAARLKVGQLPASQSGVGDPRRLSREEVHDVARAPFWRLRDSFRFARASYGLTLGAPRAPEELRMRPDAMQDHRTPTDSIDEQEVGPQVAFSEAIPVFAALRETMLAQGRWQPLAGNQRVEDIFERFGVELGVLLSGSVIALEARENDQLSSQRTASRPLSKRRPLPAASSSNDSLRVARS